MRFKRGVRGGGCDRSTVVSSCPSRRNLSFGRFFQINCIFRFVFGILKSALQYDSHIYSSDDVLLVLCNTDEAI